MVIDFSTLPKPGKDKPVLILRNLDGRAIQTLGYSFNVHAELSYNEVSTLEFDLPAYVDGVKTPHYDSVVGARMIEFVGCGRFILVDPEETTDGVRRVKHCKAYSLEYEFAKKDFFLESGTYCFYDPLRQENTIIARIIEKMPDWEVEYVDPNLVGIYRTFEDSSKKVYDFIKSDAQQKYGCIFEFNTMTRGIRITAVSSIVPTKQVYLSDQKLIKEIDINEDSDSIVTCLDVNGAEGVDIRSVNPTGLNRIYNLDYFMNTENFSQELINKWTEWNQACEDSQAAYKNLSAEYSLKTMQLLTEQNKLVSLNGELTAQENVQASCIQAIAQGLGGQELLDEANEKITEIKNRISAQESVVSEVQERLQTVSEQMATIQDSLAMQEYFTDSELSSLRKYFLEDSLQDSSFVSAQSASYTNQDIGGSLTNEDFEIVPADYYQNYLPSDPSDGDLWLVSGNTDIIVGSKRYYAGKTYHFVNSSWVLSTDVSDEDIMRQYIVESIHGENSDTYYITGGTIRFANLVGKIIRATIETRTSGSTNTFVMSAYMQSGKIAGESFSIGTFTATGTCGSVSYNDSIRFMAKTCNTYFTMNSTQLGKNSIEQDLYEYGKQVLAKKSVPSYNFSVDSGNFLSSDDFYLFQNELEFGKRVYLKIGEEDIIRPYVITVSLDYESPEDFSLEFSSTYTTADKSFALTKLLEQSVSMGKTLSVNSGVYSEFVNSGASSRVKTFMESALDLAKNAVLSSGNQAITFDDAGLRIRKWSDESKTDYDPEQIWMVDNMIAFTDNNWATASMAIGKIVDENLKGSYFKTRDRSMQQGKTYYIYDKVTNTYSPWTGSTQWSASLYEKNTEGTAYGIVAPYLVGTILAGSNLIIDTDNGAFKVDSGGVYIDSLKFYITHGSDKNQTIDSKFTELSDNTEQVATDLIRAMDQIYGDLEESMVTTYYQNTVPLGVINGDLWFCTGDVIRYGVRYYANHLYRYNGSTWDEISDATAVAAFDAAQNAQATADGKITTYYKNTVPTGASDGDLWYNTSLSTVSGYESKKLYRYNSSAKKWELVEDASIVVLTSGLNSVNATLSNVINQNGYLNASQVQGVIDSKVAQMKSNTGNVLFDTDGIWVMNATTKSQATQAVWIGEKGIAFGTGQKSSDPASTWTWGTAIAYDGIATEALATKKLSSFEISGGSINIGDGNFVVTESGDLTAKSGTFSGTVKGAAFQDSGGNNMMSGSKFKGDYLDLKGLTVRDGRGNITFAVSDSGAITIKGALSSGSSIAYGDITDKPALASVATSGKYSDLTGKPDIPTIPSYITSSGITETTIFSPNIYGGMFYSTGKGSDQTAAYYICDGVDREGRPNKPIGYISYDINGAGTADESKERVILKTIGTTVSPMPLKIMSSGNMSIGAKIETPLRTVYFDVWHESPSTFMQSATFSGGMIVGNRYHSTAEPTTPAPNGTLFFQIVG